MAFQGRAPTVSADCVDTSQSCAPRPTALDAPARRAIRCQEARRISARHVVNSGYVRGISDGASAGAWSCWQSWSAAP